MPHAREGREALNTLLFRDATILDVGAGGGEHTRWFKEQGHSVIAVDHKPEFPECHKWHWPHGKTPKSLGIHTKIAARTYSVNLPHVDAIWMAHVLEHQTNPGDFLMEAWHMLVPGGLLAVTVPPLKHDIVGGHVSLWNAGLLLYHLVLAGFDCSLASLKTYGYNITVIVPKPSLDESIRLATVLHNLNYDHGDIEALAAYFPMSVKQGFNGIISEVNWP